MSEEKLTLDKLPKGKDAIIVSIECEDKTLRAHILNMGLTPKTEITHIKTAPMGDPMELMVRGFELTLRKEDASKIVITDIHDAHKRPLKQKKYIEISHPKTGENVENNFKNKIIKKTKIHLALIGNQNCGKTTLFNRLTGSNQHVGNFPGVTVERVDGIVKGSENITITDLPGIYSLSPYSKEEVVTRNFILKDKPDGIINIVDATNIERNLLLTLQLIELNLPMVIALNMIDELNESNSAIDINGLEAALGVPVVPISAAKNQGVDELLEHVINTVQYEQKPSRLDFCKEDDTKEGAIHRAIHSIIHLIEDHAKAINIPTRFAATKLIEGDELITKELDLNENEIQTCNHIIEEMEENTKLDKYASLVDMRFNFIEDLCDKYVFKAQETLVHRVSVKIDKILTGKYSAMPSFFVIMALIFYLTFGPLGSSLSHLFAVFIGYVTQLTDNFLNLRGLNPVVHSLIIDGIFRGVGSVLSFLPTIVILFLFLSILEDTGYMARVAFIMDRLLRKIGLSGRSFVPMLIGFGCSVPAILAARTLPSERDRKMTIFLTPFMSCSAKLPIYALFCAAFFAQKAVFVILSLYLIGIIVGIVFAFFMKMFVFRGETVPFVLELPNYRMPSLANTLRLIYSKSKDFVTKAFTIIFWATIIVWFLETFDWQLNLVQNSAQSLLANIGNFVAPVFKPLGISDWRISTAFITGFMAKENVISTLSVLSGGVQSLPLMFNKLTAFVFLVFCLLYTPCVATIATVRRELGAIYAVFVVLIQCAIAWFVAFLVYNIGSLIL